MKQMTNLRVPLPRSDGRAKWQNPCVLIILSWRNLALKAQNSVPGFQVQVTRTPSLTRTRILRSGLLLITAFTESKRPYCGNTGLTPTVTVRQSQLGQPGGGSGGQT